MGADDIYISPEELHRRNLTTETTFFPLMEHQFVVIQQSHSNFRDWAKGMLFVGLGIFLKMIGSTIELIINASRYNPKIPHVNVPSLNVETWEWISLLICIVCSLILFILDKKCDSPKTILLNQIKMHFSSYKESNYENSI